MPWWIHFQETHFPQGLGHSVLETFERANSKKMTTPVFWTTKTFKKDLFSLLRLSLVGSWLWLCCDFEVLVRRLVLLNFVERVGNTVVLPPVDDDWGGVPRRHLLPSGDSRPFDLGLMSCHVLCLSCSDTCHVRQDYVSPTLICRGLLSLSLSVWVIISILHWGIDLKSLSSYTVYVDLQF